LGINATIYERAAQLEEVGAGMMLWPNATRILKTLGLLGDVARRSATNTHFLVRASSGKVLMNIALGEFDVPALCTRRSDLLASLLSAVPPDCIRLGREFSHLEQSKSKVRVHFDDAGVEERRRWSPLPCSRAVIWNIRSGLPRLHGVARRRHLRWLGNTPRR
jgi:salicylate hydroxylase